jgi:phosphoribosylformylglycinamidine synthase
MKSAVIVFPGSNCDRDAAVALTRVTGRAPAMVWHQEDALPSGVDLVVLPGGFSYGDYLRAGAIAARAPVMRAVRAHAQFGGMVLGVCNGFQVLTEAGLLPGALTRNLGQTFICREVRLKIANPNTAFTRAYGDRGETTLQVAHAGGRYIADEATLDRLEGEGRVVLRYIDNPNGSMRDVAGVIDERGCVMGLMPHPERAADPEHGTDGGWAIFESALKAA